MDAVHQRVKREKGVTSETGGRGEGVLSWQILNEKCGMWNELARRQRGVLSAELEMDKRGGTGEEVLSAGF